MSSVAQQKEHHGIALRCPMCTHDRFHEREYALRSPTASFFNHFWSQDETVAYACAKCGYVLLFAKNAATTTALNAVTSRVL